MLLVRRRQRRLCSWIQSVFRRQFNEAIFAIFPSLDWHAVFADVLAAPAA
jgi:hypothetical protein